MQTSVKTASSPPGWEDLLLNQPLDSQKLDSIKNHLNLLLLALESLAGISSDGMLRAARALDLDSIVADRVGLWRLRQSNHLWRSHQETPKTLELEEARSLVLIISYLAREHQELIRRGVSLLEQVTSQNQPPHSTQLLGEYLDTFASIYQKSTEVRASSQDTEQLAFKLVVELLFYSGANGHRRLWQLLLAKSND